MGEIKWGKVIKEGRAKQVERNKNFEKNMQMAG